MGKSFLSNRTQHVSINGSHSALANVTSGVPRGSVLGPVIFLLYINDITNQIQSNIRLFADDSSVYMEIRSPVDHHILQTDIQKLTDWSNKWQMNFNTSKCHLLIITHKPKPSELTYTISNQPISRVKYHPYLDLTIDAKLSWTKHIQSTASKSAKTLGLLKRTLYKRTLRGADNVVADALSRVSLEDNQTDVIAAMEGVMNSVINYATMAAQQGADAGIQRVVSDPNC